MSIQLSKGEKWVRLLRGYAPVAENDANRAERVDELASDLGVPKISFQHPAKELLDAAFPTDSGVFKNVVLTGTAGDGKTALCFDLINDLNRTIPNKSEGVQTITVETSVGLRKLTVIFDVTAWREKSNGHLSPSKISTLTRMAESVYGFDDEFFILAVNDGQLHEVFRYLPREVPEVLRQFETEIIKLHSKGQKSFNDRLRLINLSWVSSEEIMRLCLNAILDRPEWKCFQEESRNPLFSETSSLRRNYLAMNQPTVRKRLATIARLADASDHHLPIRGILCLITNSLLGHPSSSDTVLKPGLETADVLQLNPSHLAGFHRNFFGENLRPVNRNKREVYRFLPKLRVGDETTGDLDELIVFGSRDDELKSLYDSVIRPDPYSQRNPELEPLVESYIRGDMTEEDISRFLSEVACERRRLFLSVSDKDMEELKLWRTTVFHHAGEYINQILDNLKQDRPVPRSTILKIVTGLNRIWTGLLLTDSPLDAYITTGLDMTTSPISDILLAQIDIFGDEQPGVEIRKGSHHTIPEFLIRLKGKESCFLLSLPRFEFLCRVAAGAMPSSFSKECCTDFMALKQRCLRDLQVSTGSRVINLIETTEQGLVQKTPIHLADV
jgi:hypothetical protein